VGYESTYLTVVPRFVVVTSGILREMVPKAATLMPGKLRAGKALLAQRLVDQLGYSQRKAAKLVDQVVEVWKKTIKEGRDVDVEGLGTLTIVKRKKGHRFINGLAGPAKTIVEAYKFNTVRLKTDVKFEEVENARDEQEPVRGPEEPQQS